MTRINVRVSKAHAEHRISVLTGKTEEPVL